MNRHEKVLFRDENSGFSQAETLYYHFFGQDSSPGTLAFKLKCCEKKK
jgi:hypothetical protein